VGWLPVHRDQLRTQRSESSIRENFTFTFYCRAVYPSSIGDGRDCGKTADTIKMPLGVVGRVGQSNHVLWMGAQIPAYEAWQILGIEMVWHNVTCRETAASAVQKPAEPIMLPFGTVSKVER